VDVLGMGGHYALGGLCGGCGGAKERERGGESRQVNPWNGIPSTWTRTDV
jgi:hypothetical protein